MKWNLYEVHLMNEVPALGQGLRTVEVQLGRKWVYLRGRLSRRKYRIRTKVWESLQAKELIG